ncbi:MAG: NAD(P)/FAD-dependent oxidoreductase [Solirubrobacteraceae bacterium MAG38_C4-C5]|nr:NAD(P)/FAD-dependent oxidoreductase [Candidatus Siliceabacter maunaloa]
MQERAFDVVIIGAGPAGEVLAGRLAQHERAVALVESELVGGECSFWACMPSKALLRPAQALDEARRVQGAREAVTGELDVEAVLRRRDQIVHDLSDDHQVPWLDDRAIALVRGHGRLDGERRVRVGEETILALRAVVIATGSGAAVPPIPGLAESRPWSNREATTAAQVPPRLLVLGGGVVGVELAQAWTALGSTVTLVEAGPRILQREEPFASQDVVAALRERGVDVREGATVIGAAREGQEVVLTLESGETVAGDEVLVAVGRRPLTDDLGLETVGLSPGEHVPVDDRMQVPDRPWLYAIGDVNGRSLLTHMGKYQARVAADAIEGGNLRATRDDAGAPRVVFTDPQVAAVGLTSEQATERGVEPVVVSHPTAGTAGASFVGRGAPGTAQLVIDPRRGVVVGATFTGPEVADLLHAATIAIVGEVPVDRLWDAVAPFPTRSELWLKLLERYETDTGR